MNNYITKLVKHILLNNEDARDDWMLTIKEVHDREMEVWAYSKEQYYEAFFSNRLTNCQTIIRLWRLIQEKYPELRGKEWTERQMQAGIIKADFIKKHFSQLDFFN